jgi:hypothetical protein
MSPASGIKVTLGEVVEVAPVLLAGAEVPCCAAANHINDEDRITRGSSIVSVRRKGPVLWKGKEEKPHGEGK